MRQITLLATLFILLTGCCNNGTRLVIISTNDIHSSIDNFPALVTLVEDYRSQKNTEVLVIDAGDRWTGSPYVDMAPEQYQPIIELFNATGYDVATFGNHEWDNGNNLLAKRTSEALHTNILSNADVSGTGLDFVTPYYRTEKGGLSIGFIGLVTTAVNGHPDGKLENFGGITFHDPYTTAESYTDKAGETDLYIVISHLGFTADSLLAVKHPEIDLIIGGHSHTVLPTGMDINGTLVTQTGKNLTWAGVTEITHKKGKVTKMTNRLVPLADIEHHPQTAEMVAQYKNEPDLLEVVGTADSTLNKMALLNIFSDAMRYGNGADIAFYNVGGMRLDMLPEGDITRADVYSAEPFGNTIVLVDMTLEQIAEFILTKFNSTGKESHTLDLYPSGIFYRIVTDSEGNATDIFFDGYAPKLPTTNKPVRYTVALSDYVDSVYKYAYTGQGADTGVRIGTAAERYIQAGTPYTNSYPRVTIE